MTAAHEVSVAKEPIGVAEKRQQLTYEKTLIHSNIDLTYIF